MSDPFDFSDDDFEEVGPSGAAKHRDDVEVSIVRLGRINAQPRVQISLSAGLAARLNLNNCRVDWNRVKAAWRITGDPMGRHQFHCRPGTQRHLLRFAFPADDLYEHVGKFAAEHKAVPDHGQLFVLAPRILLEPSTAAPRPLPPPAPVPAPAPPEPARKRHPGADIDDPKVVAAALGLSTDVLPEVIGGKTFRPSERAILPLLASRERVTRMAILVATADPEKPEDDERDDKIADVHMVAIRKKLKRLNIDVTTIHGEGFALSRGDRVRLTALINEARAAA